MYRYEAKTTNPITGEISLHHPVADFYKLDDYGIHFYNEGERLDSSFEAHAKRSHVASYRHWDYVENLGVFHSDENSGM